MREVNQGGFTVIEITLFLAISGMLLLVAFAGTGLAMRNIRFNDSSRSLHSYVQKQYDEIINGVNPRDGQQACANSVVDLSTQQKAGASNCLLLGKFMKFGVNNSTVQTYLIVGREPSSIPIGDDNVVVQAYLPTVVRNLTPEVFQIPWLAPVIGMKRTTDGQLVNSYALIRSPRSSRILSYTFNDNNGNIIPLMTAGYSKLTNICVKSADNLGNAAKIVVGQGQGQDSVKIDFNVNEAGDCL